MPSTPSAHCTLCLLPFAAAAMLLPSTAQASGWYCRDAIEEDGFRSIFEQSYHEAFLPPRYIIGPMHIVSGGGFYTGWYLRYENLDTPFLAPDDMSMNIDVPAFIARGTARFERDGAAAVRVRFRGPPPGVSPDRAPFVHVRVQDNDKIAALLAARDWRVTFLDSDGKPAARRDWRFPLDMTELRALHTRHVTNIRAMERDIAGRCEPDRTEEVI